MEYLVILLILAFSILILILIVTAIVKWYRYYPRTKISVNITKKVKMDDNDFLDYYIINYGTQKIDEHINLIELWKENKIKKMNGDTIKINKFLNKCNKYNKDCFTIVGYREQTRYRQKNYVKYSYLVEVTSNEVIVSDDEILRRINFLKEHDYYVTFNNFNRIDQRKALTNELKNAIKERDKYTCQLCGKKIYDGVGLHIDHIIPVSKGGKSIPANLRVLCSKCNGSKGAKHKREE